MPKATLTSKGRVTIPKEVRRRLDLKQGDELIFHFDERGRLTVEPAKPDRLGNLVGLLHHHAGERPATVEEMNEAVLAMAKKKFLRETKR
jgi:AbrB family looped-hinge helix DNA binding protein